MGIIICCCDISTLHSLLALGMEQMLGDGLEVMVCKSSFKKLHMNIIIFQKEQYNSLENEIDGNKAPPSYLATLTALNHTSKVLYHT